MKTEWTTDLELQTLAEWAAGSNYAAEVGTWTGRSAEVLASAVRGALFCVDHFQGDLGTFDALNEMGGSSAVKAAWKQRMRKYSDRVHLVEAESMLAAEIVTSRLLGQLLDFVFIDADHAQVSRDILLWRALVRSGGTVCGHDAHYAVVRNAVREAFPSAHFGPDSLWRTVL